jgi:Na+-translocating ferredoxin:NAD+ oxidoreductase subunit B
VRPVCPVDCISLDNVSGERTGWDAWTPRQAAQALARYEQRKARLGREEVERAERLERKAVEKLADLPAHTHGGDVDRKKAVIEAALARARARRAP